MAPEILRLRSCSGSDGRIRERQSPKVDVWSLFVTIAYARDVCNYRNRSLNNNDEILNAAREACSEHWMLKYSGMAIEDPAQWASALDILNQSFNGVGATERNNDIEMCEDNDDIFSDPQLAQAIPHAQLPFLRRRSVRTRQPSIINKRTWPFYTRNRLTAIANGL